MWQMVLKTLDLLSSRRALEASGVEGAAGASGGGRRNRMEIVHTFSCIDGIMESHNIELREDDDDDNDLRRKSVKYVNFKYPPNHLFYYILCHNSGKNTTKYLHKDKSDCDVLQENMMELTAHLLLHVIITLIQCTGRVRM